MKRSINPLSHFVKACLLLALTGLGCSKSRAPQDQHIQQVHQGHRGHEGLAMEASHQVIRGDTLHLAARQEQLSAMELDTAVRHAIGQQDNLLGIATIDEEKVTLISSRVKGRVEKLLVRNPGELVRKGQAAYLIYSEELLAQVQEYRLAQQQAALPGTETQVHRQLLSAAKAKLLLWGLTPSQLRQLTRAGEPSPFLTFYSPVTGFLAGLSVREGQYVDIGTGLFKLADLRTLWVETQLYASEVRYVEDQPQVSLHFEAYPAKRYPARLVFRNPGIEENQKISLVRFRIDNPDLKIKPGMMAYVHLDRRSQPAVVIPKTALVLGAMKSVWVKTAAGMYERRMVRTGVENKNEVEILSGIEPGEVVVSSGGYLLSGELTLRQGGMKGHAHAGED
ncbi:MAG: efflux RND transporter periplasmic adaptor subunit [Adhaeribacter sp.]